MHRFGKKPSLLQERVRAPRPSCHPLRPRHRRCPSVARGRAVGGLHPVPAGRTLRLRGLLPPEVDSADVREKPVSVFVQELRSHSKPGFFEQILGEAEIV